MENTVELRGVYKRYGDVRALDGLTLCARGGMFGLLGRNGAGKSTLMRILATLARKDEGEALVCGVPVEKGRAVREMIGYLPQDFNMYGGMRVREALDYLGVLSGLDAATRRARAQQLLERVNLLDAANRRVRALSGGMRRRLGIAQALLHDPRVLIVDEPTAGLDPEERVRFRNLLGEAALDRLVLLSTHIVADIEAACENVAILDAGRLRYLGTVAKLVERARGKVFQAELPQGAAAEFQRNFRVISAVSHGDRCLARFLAPDGAPGVGRPQEPGVEDAYMLCLCAGEEQ